jgi:hypothetical protein
VGLPFSKWRQPVSASDPGAMGCASRAAARASNVERILVRTRARTARSPFPSTVPDAPGS